VVKISKSFISLGKKLQQMKKGIKGLKGKASYTSASSMIMKTINKMCKLKPHNENLIIFRDQIKIAIENKDEEAYKKWLKAFRNEFMFDIGKSTGE